MGDEPVTPERLRALADAVDGSNGVQFQPIFPDTLRDWADEIERLREVERLWAPKRSVFGASVPNMTEGSARMAEAPEVSGDFLTRVSETHGIRQTGAYGKRWEAAPITKGGVWHPTAGLFRTKWEAEEAAERLNTKER